MRGFPDVGHGAAGIMVSVLTYNFDDKIKIPWFSTDYYDD